MSIRLGTFLAIFYGGTVLLILMIIIVTMAWAATKEAEERLRLEFKHIPIDENLRL